MAHALRWQSSCVHSIASEREQVTPKMDKTLTPYLSAQHH